MAEIYFSKSSPLTDNGGYLQGKIVYSFNQSISDNTSSVTCTVYVKKDADNYKLTQTTNGTFKYTLSVNGTSVTGEKKLEILTSFLAIGSFTMAIPHNNDGTKTFNINGNVTMTSNRSSKFYGKKSYINTNIELTTIPRASIINSLSCSTSYFDGTLTYKYTPQSSSYYNRCNISLNINNDFIAVKSINLGAKSASQQTATVILSSSELSTIYKNLPSGTSGTLRFTFRTYFDSSYSTQVGNASYEEVKLTIPTSIKPSIGTITLDPIDIPTVYGNPKNILVKGKNKLNISVSGCAAGTGSSIVSYTFSGQNISSTVSSTSTSASATSNTMSASGTFTYTVTIKDKRGRTASKTASITCYAYNVDDLVFSSFTAYRCKSDGTADNNGTYIKYNVKINYPSVNSTNTGTVKIYYRENTNTSWIAAANALTNSTNKSIDGFISNSSGNKISNFKANSTYLVYAVLADNFNQSVKSTTITIFGASRIFNIRKDGSGVAFGKMAESDNLFEIKWPLQVDNQITFGSGTQGRMSCVDNQGTNVVYIQTGQNISGGTTMVLAMHAGAQATGTDSPSVYIENPSNNGKVNLGSSGRRWNQLFATNGTISTSDRNAKTSITYMSDTQEQLFNKLRPVTFKLKDGSSGRTHYGFISQDVEDSLGELKLTGKDFAGFCKDLCVDENGEAMLDEEGNKIYDYSLRYSEFVALNTHMIQKLQNEITELKAEIAELKSTT